MTTSDNFDIFPICKQDVIFRTFDNLIGFSNKYKKGKMKKAIKEEWDPIQGKYIDDRIAKTKRIKELAEFKSKAKKIDLDKNPIKRAALKQDTEYSVGELSRILWNNNPNFGGATVQGKWEDAKAVESSLRASKTLRDHADKYAIGKLGHKKDKKKAEKESSKEIDYFDLAKRAMKSKNPDVKKIVGDIKSEAILRRMMAKDEASARKLEALLKTINEEDSAQKLADFKVDCGKKIAIFKRILAKLEGYIKTHANDPEFIASCFDDFAEDVTAEVDELKDIYELY